VTREEFFETFSVGLVVGGSIVIPHLRRAVDFLDQLEGGAAAPEARALRVVPAAGRHPLNPTWPRLPASGQRTTGPRGGLSRDPTAQEPLLVEGARRQARGKEECAGNSAWAGHWDHGLFGTSAPAQA
jgi:hypothetical protein